MHKPHMAISILLIALGAGLISCNQNQSHMLRVESPDSTHSSLPFLVAFFDEEGKTYVDTFLVVRHTPFDMVVPGTRCLVIIKDTSSINPALHASLDTIQVFFHNSTVVFRNSKDGIQIQHLR